MNRLAYRRTEWADKANKEYNVIRLEVNKQCGFRRSYIHEDMGGIWLGATVKPTPKYDDRTITLLRPEDAAGYGFDKEQWTVTFISVDGDWRLPKQFASQEAAVRYFIAQCKKYPKH